jgi:predicted DNA-binding protein (UPF0251 family)
MKDTVISIPEKTIPERTIAVPPKAAAALQRAREIKATIESITHELAAERADAIRVALDAGMSQADVARVLGISGQAVHNILRQH